MLKSAERTTSRHRAGKKGDHSSEEVRMLLTGWRRQPLEEIERRLLWLRRLTVQGTRAWGRRRLTPN
jgi:hypothetical protein